MLSEEPGGQSRLEVENIPRTLNEPCCFREFSPESRPEAHFSIRQDTDPAKKDRH